MGKVNIKQLNVAPASGYVIGSGAGGVPQWEANLRAIFPYNHIHIDYPYTPFISPTSGQDEIIRELGNVIYDDDLNKYLFVYTGCTSPNVGTNLRVYLASSVDGETWVKEGAITTTGSEDPYLIKHNGTYFLYVEKRGAGTLHECIELWSGIDIMALTSQGQVLEEVAATWESQDVSSPVVYIEGSTWYMYYEGRSATQQGAIGLATSADGITWVKDVGNPIVSGTEINGDISYATHCVPDDIIKIGDYYYMSYHPHNGSVYVPAYLWSTDLLNWNDVLNTWFTVGMDENDYGGAGTMFFRSNNGLKVIYSPNDDVYIAALSNSGQNNLRVSDAWTTFLGTKYIMSGGKNEIIAPELTANLSLQLNSDLVSNRGTYKIIQNKSDTYSIDITPESGVTVDGSSSQFTVLPEETKWIYLKSEDEWITLKIGGDSYSIGNGLTLNGSTIDLGGTVNPSIGHTMAESNRFNWTKTAGSFSNSTRMLYSDLSFATNSLHELSVDGVAPIVQRAQFVNGSIHSVRPDRTIQPNTIDRFGIALYGQDLSNSGRSYSFPNGNTNIQGNRVYMSIGTPTNTLGINTEYTIYSGVINPISTASTRISTITGLGIKLFGDIAEYSNTRIQRIVGSSVGLRTTATSQQIGYAVFSTDASETTGGSSNNSAVNNTTITNEIEQTGTFAFYDQTGWNNYFKGSLGLGNPVPVSKLDVTGDINTTVGFKISGAATLGNYLRGNGTNFVSSALTASDLAANSITDGLIRQSAGLSVIGRSANSTGNVADITAGTDLHVLRRSGTSIGFGLLTLGSISATNNQLFYGVGGVAGQSANMTYDGTTATFTSGFSSVSNIQNGVNYSGTSTATADGAYGVRYSHVLTANNSANHIVTGVRFVPTLIAASNFNALYGVVIDPTFTLGAFTNTTSIPLYIVERTTDGQSIRIQNATASNTNGISLHDNTNVQRAYLNYFGTLGHTILSFSAPTQNRLNYSNTSLLIQNGFSTKATYFNTTAYYSHTPTGSTAISGTSIAHNLSHSFAPTSGTGIHNWLQIDGAINQTGGANGITRGVYVDHTLTAAADYRAIETSGGKTILGGATGSLSVGSGTFTAANGVINATTGYRVNNAATSGSTLMGDGTNFVPATRAQFLGYKEYVALLSQSGTDAPVATVLYNDLGGTVVWTRDGPGDYYGALVGAFTNLKTWIMIGTTDVGSIFGSFRTDADNIYISSPISGDNTLNETSISIRVYN